MRNVGPSRAMFSPLSDCAMLARSWSARQPNAIARIVNIDSGTKKIIIVAKRHIKPGEEVHFVVCVF